MALKTVGCKTKKNPQQCLHCSLEGLGSLFVHGNCDDLEIASETLGMQFLSIPWRIFCCAHTTAKTNQPDEIYKHCCKLCESFGGTISNITRSLTWGHKMTENRFWSSEKPRGATLDHPTHLSITQSKHRFVPSQQLGRNLKQSVTVFCCAHAAGQTNQPNKIYQNRLQPCENSRGAILNITRSFTWWIKTSKAAFGPVRNREVLF